MSKLRLQSDIIDDKDISSILQFRPVTKQDKEAGRRIELSQVNGRIQVETKTKTNKVVDRLAYLSDLQNLSTSDLIARIEVLEAIVAKLTRFATVIDESIHFEGWAENFS